MKRTLVKVEVNEKAENDTSVSDDDSDRSDRNSVSGPNSEPPAARKALTPTTSPVPRRADSRRSSSSSSESENFKGVELSANSIKLQEFDDDKSVTKTSKSDDIDNVTSKPESDDESERDTILGMLEDDRAGGGLSPPRDDVDESAALLISDAESDNAENLDDVAAVLDGDDIDTITTMDVSDAGSDEDCVVLTSKEDHVNVKPEVDDIAAGPEGNIIDALTTMDDSDAGSDEDCVVVKARKEDDVDGVNIKSEMDDFGDIVAVPDGDIFDIDTTLDVSDAGSDEDCSAGKTPKVDDVQVNSEPVVAAGPECEDVDDGKKVPESDAESDKSDDVTAAPVIDADGDEVPDSDAKSNIRKVKATSESDDVAKEMSTSKSDADETDVSVTKISDAAKGKDRASPRKSKSEDSDAVSAKQKKSALSSIGVVALSKNAVSDAELENEKAKWKVLMSSSDRLVLSVLVSACRVDNIMK